MLAAVAGGKAVLLPHASRDRETDRGAVGGIGRLKAKKREGWGAWSVPRSEAPRWGEYELAHRGALVLESINDGGGLKRVVTPVYNSF